MMEERHIRILLIEDETADVALVGHELRKGGLAFHTRQVDSREAFLQELQQDPPDVILSDHGLPAFDGFTALAVARENCPDVPFIFVTGSLGEEKVIETFESGAANCVLKNRLSKLVPAVLRALREAEERRKRRAEEAERERRLHELAQEVIKSRAEKRLLPICAQCKSVRDENDCWHIVERYFHKHFDVDFTHGLCPDCVSLFFSRQLTKAE